MQIKLKRDVTIETDAMALSELQDIDDNIQIDIDLMQAQIDEAKGTRMATGEYAERTWWKNVNLAIKLTRRNRQRLVRVIAERKREEAQVVSLADAQRFERAFMLAAKKMLPPEMYLDLVAATRDRVEVGVHR